MKVEERYGFTAPLDLDNEVWRVLPKIQARLLKSMLASDRGLEALRQCLTTRLTLEGFRFVAKTVETPSGSRLRLTITECPWHNLMLKSGREHLSESVGTRICNTEYRVWAAEFGDDIIFELQGQICRARESCTLLFTAPI